MSRFFLALTLVGALSAPTIADELLVAPDDAPQYELSNIQRDADVFGRTVLVIDYKRLRKAAQPHIQVSIAGKTSNGELTGFGIQQLEESGKLRIALQGMLFGGNDFEVYLVVRASSDKKYMVSNAVRLGNPGPATTARPWTEEEKQAAERAKQFRTPPAEIPTGFLPVTAETTLVPGMPIKAGDYGKWADAEVIRFEEVGSVTLKYPAQDTLQVHPREKWLAVDPEVLAKAESNPDQFQVSIRVLPDSLLIIPDGDIPLDENIELPPGTPLILDDGYAWKNIFVVDTDGENIKVRYEGFEANWDKEKSRSQFVIKKRTLAMLSQPDKVKKFADNLISPSARRAAEWEATRQAHEEAMAAHSKEIRERIAAVQARIRHQSYPIDIPLPKRAQLVPADLELEPRTPLAACWAREWQPLTVLHENDDGSVHVRWDDRSSAFDCDITRDHLIIEDKVVRRLRRKSSAPTPDDLTTVLRTWTDITGKHKIEAFFVRNTDTEVTLKTDAGRELTLPIEKLSEKDRALISAPTGDDDNPFE